jgi:AsmA protein
MVRRMKWVAALCFALIAIGAGFYRWPISSEFVAEEIGAPLSRSLGMELGRPTRVWFSVLPMPTLHITDVELRGQDRTIVLTAPDATVRLGLAPALMGRLELASAALNRPTILIDLDSDPLASNSAIAATMAKKNDDRTSAPIGAFQIRSGLLHVVSAAHEVDTLVEDVNGALDWRTLKDAARLNLQATWRDQPLAVEARLGDPVALLRGERSQGSLSIVSGGAQIKFDGDVVGDAQRRFEGSVSVDVASSADVARILGRPKSSDLSEGHMSLAAKAAANGRTLTLSELRLNVLEQSFEGALAFTKDAGRISVSGTMAADELKLAPILAKAPPIIDPNGAWSDASIDFKPLAAVKFDLRISAARVEWRGHSLTDAAIELMNENDRLTASLIEAGAYGGLAKAEIIFSPLRIPVEAHASGSVTNADIGALSAEFGRPAYSGLGGAQFSFDTVGDSVQAMFRRLEGKATILLGPGIVDGLSFEEALRRSERRSIDVFNDMRMGRTVFTQAAATLTIEKGGIGNINAVLAGPGVNASLTGTTDVVDQKLWARATVTQTNEAGAPTPDGPQIDFDIAGPWSAPSIKPLAVSQ